MIRNCPKCASRWSCIIITLAFWTTCVIVIWPLNAVVRAKKYWMSPEKMEDSSTLRKVCYVSTDSGLMIYDHLRKKTSSRCRWSIGLYWKKTTQNTHPPQTTTTTTKTKTSEKSESSPWQTLLLLSWQAVHCWRADWCVGEQKVHFPFPLTRAMWLQLGFEQVPVKRSEISIMV